MKRLSLLVLIVCTVSWALEASSNDSVPVSLLVYGSANGRADLTPPLRTQSVFDENEKAILSEIGADDLSRVERVEFENAAQAKRYIEEIRARDPNSVIETNSSFVLHEAISTEQWGLDNRGGAQRIVLDKTRSLQIDGIAGEDIGIRRMNIDTTRNPDPKEARVAILDTGIDPDHPALKDALVRHESECQAHAQYQKCLDAATDVPGKQACDKQFAKLDTDGNGYALDCTGWNAVLSNGTMLDDRGHGTHVAGIVAARPAAFDIRGVNPKARIIPIRVTDNSPNPPIQPQDNEAGAPTQPKSEASGPLPGAPVGKNLLDAVARGLLYAIKEKADVINLSLAWPANADTSIVRRLVEIAIDRGITVVASAGNDSTESRVYPCQYDRVVCVASHNADGKLSYFSNYGSSVDLVAPGQRILSTWPMNRAPTVFTDQLGYEFKNGTSMAAPMVAGMASVLRSLGFSERETSSRLFWGARPIRLGERSRFTRFGNADVASSIALSPRPLILPIHKAPLVVEWDGQSRKAEVEIALRNEWAAAEATEIAVQILDEKLNLSLVSTSENIVNEVAWLPGDERAIRLQLNFPNHLFPGRLFAELRIRESAEALHTVLVPIEIVRVVSKSASSPEWIKKSIRGESLPKEIQIRTVVNVDGPPDENHYLAIRSVPGAQEFSVLFDEKDSFVRSATGHIATSKDEPADLLLAQRVDVDLDGEDDFVLLVNRTLIRAKRSQFEFRVFDREMNEKESLKLAYDNLTSVIPENFKWTTITLADGTKRKVPAWFAFGSVPTNERSTDYDPWNPNPSYPKDFRIYYLTPDGAKTVPEVDQLNPVTLLSADAPNRPIGVLLADNRKLPLKYFTASLEDGSLRELNAIALSQYRTLLGLSDIKPVIDLEPRDGAQDLIFTGPSGYGNSRTTLFSTTPTTETVSFELHPDQKIDSIQQALAAFRHSSPFGTQLITASLSLFDIVFEDHATGRVASLSQNRFSYMANLLFQKTFFPVVAATEINDLSPAVMIPPGISGDTPLEIVLARLSSSGAMTEILRPAYYRFANSDDCSLVGNALRPDADAPSRLVYFCNDEMIQIPLIRAIH